MGIISPLKSYLYQVLHLTKKSKTASKCTYIHNKEVQPTPGVSEVLDKAVGHPLQQHLQDEYVGENTVSVVQNDADGLSLLNVHILKSLEGKGDQETASVILLGKNTYSVWYAFCLCMPTVLGACNCLNISIILYCYIWFYVILHFVQHFLSFVYFLIYQIDAKTKWMIKTFCFNQTDQIVMISSKMNFASWKAALQELYQHREQLQRKSSKWCCLIKFIETWDKNVLISAVFSYKLFSGLYILRCNTSAIKALFLCAAHD